MKSRNTVPVLPETETGLAVSTVSRRRIPVFRMFPDAGANKKPAGWKHGRF